MLATNLTNLTTAEKSVYLGGNSLQGRVQFPTGGITHERKHDLVKFQGRRYSPDARR